VELLVVIGIIGVLIAILLPSLNSARESARTISCASNLKQIATALLNYAAEHKGTLPPGFTWNQINPASATAGPAAGTTSWISWFSAAEKYMAPRRTINSAPHPSVPTDWRTLEFPISQAFRCPSAGPDFQQGVHYAANNVLMRNFRIEYAYTTPGKPRVLSINLSQTYPDNAMVWDSQLLSGMGSLEPYPFFTISGMTMIPGSFIDLGDTPAWWPEEPWRQYRPVPASRASSVTPDNDPILYWTDNYFQSLGLPGGKSFNSDIGGNMIILGMLGNLRFRHQKDSIANVAFVDGSVQKITLNKSQTFTRYGEESYVTDFKMSYLRPKWPASKESEK
jgi:prepilin-type processing-associated H-X9-DG protein